MRERLIELLRDTFNYTKGVCIDFDEAVEINADHLLANGVIVSPCKVGDKMYFYGEYFADRFAGEIMERTVDVVLTEAWATFRGEVDISFDFDDFGKKVFLTREEAEEALAKMKGGAET